MKVDITNLYEDVTGIEGKVVINRKSHGQKTPCLRYYVQDIEISVSIEDIPKVLIPKSLYGRVPTEYHGIVCWILLNRPVLLDYWHNPEYPTNRLLNSLKKLNELNEDEIDELRPFDSTSYAMRRIGLPYVAWVYTYKTELIPIVKITEPKTGSFIIASIKGVPIITELEGIEFFKENIPKIENWLYKNRDTLLSYWANRIDSVELCDRLMLYEGYIQNN